MGTLWEQWGGDHGGSHQSLNVHEDCVNHQYNHLRIQLLPSEDTINESLEFVQLVFEVARLSNSRKHMHLDFIGAKWDIFTCAFYKKFGIRKIFRSDDKMIPIDPVQDDEAVFKFQSPFDKLNDQSPEVLKLVLDL